MSNRSLTALLALVAALVGTLAWIASKKGEVERTAVAASASSADVGVESDDVPAHDGVLQSVLVPDSVPAPDAPAEAAISVPAHSQAESARNAVRTAYDLELDAARWVDGRVLFPPGTPADERVFVVAKGRAFTHGPPHRVPVAADGTFRIAFAAKTFVGQLELEARYLRLKRPERVKLDDAPVRVDLVPVLGGQLRGRLLPPEADVEDAKELAGKKLTLELKESPGQEVDPGARYRATEIGADLAFELGGLHAGAYQLEFVSPPFVPVRIDEIVVELGRVSSVDVPLERGVTLVGRALDEAGRPVAGASIMAFSRSATSGPPMLANGSVLSDETGAFVVGGVAPGRIELQASKRGLADASVELGALAYGEVHEGIELVLARGLSIAGTVLWPDGTRAAGALVQATSEGGHTPGNLFGERWTTDAEGRFHISGLDPGTFRIESTADCPAKLLEADPSIPRERGEATLHSIVAGVAAGTEDLVLSLNAGAVVRGRVLDERGQPVREFTIEATRPRIRPTVKPEKLTGLFQDPAGTFELGGFQPGTWKLVASASEGRASRPVFVECPGAPDSLELVLRACGSVAGEARDAEGRALAGRTIELESRGMSRFFQTLVTDDAGRFFADNVPPGDCAVRLRAHYPDVSFVLDSLQDTSPWERSAFVHVMERETAHVLLVLPEVDPVRVSGQVRIGDHPAASARITFQDRGENGASTTCMTDKNGRYSIVLGRPGAYFVRLFAKDVSSFTDSVEIPAAASFVLDLSIEFGRISGHVRSLEREPLEGILVEAEGSGAGRPSTLTSTDVEGRYTLLVPAGTYTIRASDRYDPWPLTPERVRFGESRLPNVVVEPDARMENVDLVLAPGGAVEGVVRWADGTIAEGVELSVFEANGLRIAFGFSAGGGRFRVEGIEPGACVLNAYSGEPRGVAQAEITVSSSETLEVELVLEKATRLFVRTLSAAGGEVAADVEVEDSRGHRGRTMRHSGSNGLVELGPLGPGPYTVRARYGGREQEKSVELAGEEAREIEIVFR